MRIAAGLEYDGRGFNGWQSQFGARTVQDCVEQAISKVANEPVAVITAGRTDSGVHAGYQVIHFDTRSARSAVSWSRGVNTFLPSDVALLWTHVVDESFHARFAACSRSYRYIILNRKTPPALFARRATWDYRGLDVDRMRAASCSLIGEHDFSAYRAAGCQAASPIREIIELTVNRSGDWLWIDVTANAFLQHMVRNIAGVLCAIGAGERPVSWAEEVLKTRDRRCGGVTAPPDGLYLVAISYPITYHLPEPPDPIRFW